MREVERRRGELAVEEAQSMGEGTVELDVGGVRFVTAVSTLCSRPSSILGGYVEGCKYFVDRDGGTAVWARVGVPAGWSGGSGRGGGRGGGRWWRTFAWRDPGTATCGAG